MMGNQESLTVNRLSKKGGVFSKLRDPEFFRRVHIHKELAVLTWDDEIDIAPETVYSIATGSPLPDWMEDREQVA
jgi:hypothetical protein